MKECGWVNLREQPEIGKEICTSNLAPNLGLAIRCFCPALNNNLWVKSCQIGNQICEKLLNCAVVSEYSLHKSTQKAYGFDNANTNSSSNITSGSANFRRTVMSVFSFSKSEKATANFNTSNGDLRQKLKFREYYTSIKPVDNVDPVDPSGNQKVLVGDTSTVDEKSDISKRSWVNKVWDVIRKDCKFSNVSWATFFASNK